jgi:hypothetical protein
VIITSNPPSMTDPESTPVSSTIIFLSRHSLWSTGRASGLTLYLDRFWRVCGVRG